jgi:hypothetical protein
LQQLQRGTAAADTVAAAGGAGLRQPVADESKAVPFECHFAVETAADRTDARTCSECEGSIITCATRYRREKKLRRKPTSLAESNLVNGKNRSTFESRLLLIARRRNS